MRDKALALAGIFQGASLVSDIATRGKTQKSYFDASIGSLLSGTDEGITGLYGKTANLKPGLECLENFLTSRNTKTADFIHILSYTRQLILLADIMMQDAGKVGTVALAIDELSEKHGKVNKISIELVRRIARIYCQNFSSLPAKNRIRVNGKKEFLTPTDNVARIRAALFAGIRAAVFWRHLGGRWPHTFIGSGKLLRQLADIKNTEL